MKSWFKKNIFSARSMKNSSEIKPLKPYFKSSYYWSYDKQAVARGVAAGFAAAVIPGFQIFYAAILVIILRGNLGIALLSTLLTNPLTFAPITWFIYFIGSLILKNGGDNFVVKKMHWQFSSLAAFWSNVLDWVYQFGHGYLLGLPIVSFCLGMIGYFGTILIWEIYLFLRAANKKK